MKITRNFRSSLLRSGIVLPILLTGAMGLHWGLSASAQNVVTNGDFESLPYDMRGTVTDWTVSGNGSIEAIAEGSTSPTHSAGFNVGDNSEGNILSQSFATTAGQVYRMDFDAGVFGVPDTGSTLQLRVQVFGTATPLDQTVTPPSADTFDPNSVIFQHYYFTFTADSTTTTLQFSDMGTGNAGADTMVDTVSVVPDQNILVNGDFETGPFDTIGTVTSWTVGGTGCGGIGCVADRGEEGRPARPTQRRSTSAAILRAIRSPKVSSRSPD
jgi:hypothetical protein